jgi:hypothetical protein
LLAQAAPTTTRAVHVPKTPPPTELLAFPTQWPSQADVLRWAHDMPGEATTVLIVAGIVYLLWGFYLYKGLVVLNAGVVGAFLGAAIGQKTGAAVPGAVLGGFTAAAVSFPVMKWSVATIGAILGGLVGGCVWRLAGLDPNFAWSGAMTGMVGFCLLGFIVQRFCLLMYTSLQGSGMLVLGILSLIYKYQGSAPRLNATLLGRPSLLPMVIFFLTVAGMLYQESANKTKPPGGGGGPPKK